MKKKVRLMFDSGAFSAWKKNEPIAVEEYIEFLHKHKHLMYSYVALDSIPGRPGETRSPQMVEESADTGWRNYRKMVKAGLDPIPVYHMGERRYWLEKILDSGAKYIGIGGVATLSEEMRRPWLDAIFSFLCGKGGYPIPKVHGFGITSVETFHRYPWFTVDSVSWRLHAAYGWAVIPVPESWKQKDNYNYKKTPYCIYISKGNADGSLHKSAKGKDHQHIKTMSPQMKQYIERYLATLNLTIDECLKDDQARTVISLVFYMRSAAAFVPTPFRDRSCSLFGKGNQPGGSDHYQGKFQMFFGVSPSRGLINCLADNGASNMLLSYAYFRGDKKVLDLERFVRAGRINKKREHLNV